MKKLFIFSVILVVLASVPSFGQSTAMNFNRKDCNGVQRHLFADLDSGNVVIIEYFMTSCAPCPAAGQKLEAMKANLLTQFPGKVISYAIAFNNTYSQATVKNWVNTYSFTSIPMDSGAAQVAYYGGMGMPTIVVLGGKNTHSVLGAPYIGFANSDTTKMAANIRAYLAPPTGTTSLAQGEQASAKLEVFPSPAGNQVTVSINSRGQKFTVSITDLRGRIVKQTEESTDLNSPITIDVRELSPGLYNISASTADFTETKRIVIGK